MLEVYFLKELYSYCAKDKINKNFSDLPTLFQNKAEIGNKTILGLRICL